MEEKSVWMCWVTKKPIDINECRDCHTQSCPINTGFADDPIYIDEIKQDVKVPEKESTEEMYSSTGELFRWRCWVTSKPFDPDECRDCHTQSCPINTGFADDPIPIDED